MIFQTTLRDDWEFVEEQINRSKIKRYPYKAILGKSLTTYVLECRDAGLSSTQTILRLLQERSIQTYLSLYPFEEDNFKKNIEISVRARYSEEKIRGR